MNTNILIVGLHTFAHLLPLFIVVNASGMIAATAKNSNMPETHTPHSKGKVVATIKSGSKTISTTVESHKSSVDEIQEILTQSKSSSSSR